MLRFFCYIGLHYWRPVEWRGAWLYSQCRHCGRRKASNIPGRMGPRNDHWLATGQWDDGTRPIPPRAGQKPDFVIRFP
jgi:hypothetical protein